MLETLKTLTAICSNNDVAKACFRELDGISFIVTLLSSTSNLTITEFCLHSLACVADNNVYNQQDLTSPAMFEFLHLVLSQKHISGARINLLKSAVLLLIILVAHNSLGQKLLTEKGCLHDLIDHYQSTCPLLVFETRRHENQSFPSLDLWQAINGALCFAVNNPQNEENQTVCSMLFPVGLRILKHETNYKVLRAVSTFLALTVSANIQNQEILVEYGALSVIKDCLQNLVRCIVTSQYEQGLHVGLLSAAVGVMNVLDVIVTDHEKNANTAGQMGLVSALVSYLTLDIREIEFKVKVIVTLGHCVDICEKYQGEIIQEDALKNLLRIGLETKSRDLQSATHYLLKVCLNLDISNEQEGCNFSQLKKVFEDRIKKEMCAISRVDVKSEDIQRLIATRNDNERRDHVGKLKMEDFETLKKENLLRKYLRETVLSFSTDPKNDQSRKIENTLGKTFQTNSENKTSCFAPEDLLTHDKVTEPFHLQPLLQSDNRLNQHYGLRQQENNVKSKNCFSVSQNSCCHLESKFHLPVEAVGEHRIPQGNDKEFCKSSYLKDINGRGNKHCEKNNLSEQNVKCKFVNEETFQQEINQSSDKQCIYQSGENHVRDIPTSLSQSIQSLNSGCEMCPEKLIFNNDCKVTSTRHQKELEEFKNIRVIQNLPIKEKCFHSCKFQEQNNMSDDSGCKCCYQSKWLEETKNNSKEKQITEAVSKAKKLPEEKGSIPLEACNCFCCHKGKQKGLLTVNQWNGETYGSLNYVGQQVKNRSGSMETACQHYKQNQESLGNYKEQNRQRVGNAYIDNQRDKQRRNSLERLSCNLESGRDRLEAVVQKTVKENSVSQPIKGDSEKLKTVEQQNKQEYDNLDKQAGEILVQNNGSLDTWRHQGSKENQKWFTPKNIDIYQFLTANSETGKHVSLDNSVRMDLVKLQCKIGQDKVKKTLVHSQNSLTCNCSLFCSCLSPIGPRLEQPSLVSQSREIQKYSSNQTQVQKLPQEAIAVKSPVSQNHSLEVKRKIFKSHKPSSVLKTSIRETGRHCKNTSGLKSKDGQHDEGQVSALQQDVFSPSSTNNHSNVNNSYAVVSEISHLLHSQSKIKSAVEKHVSPSGNKMTSKSRTVRHECNKKDLNEGIFKVPKVPQCKTSPVRDDTSSIFSDVLSECDFGLLKQVDQQHVCNNSVKKRPLSSSRAPLFLDKKTLGLVSKQYDTEAQHERKSRSSNTSLSSVASCSWVLNWFKKHSFSDNLKNIPKRRINTGKEEVIFKVNKCPGCVEPAAAESSLLTSRNYVSVLENFPFTCNFHRELRKVERKYVKQRCRNRFIHKKVPAQLTGGKTSQFNKENTRKRDLYSFTESEMDSFSSSESSQALPPLKRSRRARVPFSEEEEKFIEEGAVKLNRNWKCILGTYDFHPSRRPVDLYDKYRRMKKKQSMFNQEIKYEVGNNSEVGHPLKKESLPLSICEERRLKHGVYKFGHNWKVILSSYKFNHQRTASELRERWRKLCKREKK
ncbi:uncharacterized protein LOC143256503 isoform X2 [Tachypleus tridentatus]